MKHSPVSCMNTKAPIPVVKALPLKTIAAGKIHKFHYHITDNGLGFPVLLPVIVAKGKKPGPVLGFTAAVHGNELNGIKVIHRLMAELQDEINHLHGTIIGVPVVNAYGAVNSSRLFNNGEDLNRIMPGKKNGNSSAQYVHRFLKDIIKPLDFLVDLHTASFGRVNSLYVRADMEDPVASKMAHLQHPQIIVHNKGRDGSLRGAAERLGIPAITVEVGDPQKFQRRLIRESLIGIHNILSHFGMLPGEVVMSGHDPIVCNKSYWIFTSRGGILDIFSELSHEVKKGDRIARLTNLFGEPIEEYFAPANGVVVGKSTNPISQTGARIIHLGIKGKIALRV